MRQENVFDLKFVLSGERKINANIALRVNHCRYPSLVVAD
jgi:hypothetical protein